MTSLYPAYTERVGRVHDERLRNEIEATIANLDDQSSDPTLDDEERADVRESLDFLVGYLRKHYP